LDGDFRYTLHDLQGARMYSVSLGYETCFEAGSCGAEILLEDGLRLPKPQCLLSDNAPGRNKLIYFSV